MLKMIAEANSTVDATPTWGRASRNSLLEPIENPRQNISARMDPERILSKLGCRPLRK